MSPQEYIKSWLNSQVKSDENIANIAIIFKNNKPYVCVGFNQNKRMDQLYCKYNKLPPIEEYNLLKRNLVCL